MFPTPSSFPRGNYKKKPNELISVKVWPEYKTQRHGGLSVYHFSSSSSSEQGVVFLFRESSSCLLYFWLADRRHSPMHIAPLKVVHILSNACSFSWFPTSCISALLLLLLLRVYACRYSNFHQPSEESNKLFHNGVKCAYSPSFIEHNGTFLNRPEQSQA